MIKYPPGRNEGTVSILISDLRDVLEPPTASSLSESLKMQGCKISQKSIFLPPPLLKIICFLYACTTFIFNFVFSIEHT